MYAGPYRAKVIRERAAAGRSTTSSLELLGRLWTLSERDGPPEGFERSAGAAVPQPNGGRELHCDVEHRAEGVLHGVADGVVGHRVLVGLGALGELLVKATGGMSFLRCPMRPRWRSSNSPAWTLDAERGPEVGAGVLAEA